MRKDSLVYEKKVTKQEQDVTDLLGSVSVHGVSNLMRSKRIVIKLIWIVLISLSAFCCFDSIVASISSFMSFSVMTNLKIEKKGSLTVPGLTICNRNQNLSIDQMLLQCIIFPDKPCNSSSFRQTNVYNRTDGICYSFNMFLDRPVIFYGPKHFIKFDIFTGLTSDLITDESGIRLMISDNNYYTQIEKGIDLSSGKFITVVELK